MTKRAEQRPRSRRAYSARNERGASLIEAMVGIVLMTVVLLGIGQAMGSAMRAIAHSGQDLQLWADVQRKADSLTALSAATLVSGSDVVGGRDISWTVTGSNPVRVDLTADRQLTNRQIAQYSLVLFLRN